MTTLSDFNVSMFGSAASCQTAGSVCKFAILTRTTFIEPTRRGARVDYSKVRTALAATQGDYPRIDFFANAIQNKAQ